MCLFFGSAHLCEEASVVRPSETASSADLGVSSKYSNENFEA